MRFRNLFFVGSLVGLLGLSGCKERTELIDGYKIIQYGLEGVIYVFEHNDIKKVDRLIDYTNTNRNFFTDYTNTNTEFTDYGCDGEVEEITSLDWYERGEIGTERLFERADSMYAELKKELGIEE